jgi:hypothetical protein
VEPDQRRSTGAGTEALVVVDGDVVTKLHRPGTDPQALTQRLRIAARSDCFLSPLSLEPEAVGELWQTRWPRVDVVPPDPGAVPWASAGRLLARLHAEPVVDVALPQGGPARLARALGRLDGPNADVIRRAAAALTAPLSWRPVTLVHGDFHLGQLGRQAGTLLLIDVDDLGVGDPAADLARPAGFWAAGLLPDAAWHAFLDGYRDGGGPGLPPGDPWPVLDSFARTAVVAAAANHPDDDLLVAACERMR